MQTARANPSGATPVALASPSAALPAVPDAELIRRAQSRDEEATSILYEVCYPKVLGYCRARLDGFDAAADAATVVIEKMLRALPHYRYTGVPFQAWLNRIARNHILDTVRKEKSRPVIVRTEWLTEIGCVDKGFDNVLHDHTLRTALARLTPVQRRVLELRYVEGYDIESIARAINRRPAAAKSLHFRAIRALRKILT
jgi:RNA polymerase sigma-70 factor, ECF subfamily